MKPENHAIRQLEKQIEAAPPEVAAAMPRVILALKMCLLNKADPAALEFAKRTVAQEVAALSDVLKK